MIIHPWSILWGLWFQRSVGSQWLLYNFSLPYGITTTVPSLVLVKCQLISLSHINKFKLISKFYLVSCYLIFSCAHLLWVNINLDFISHEMVMLFCLSERPTILHIANGHTASAYWLTYLPTVFLFWSFLRVV